MVCLVRLGDWIFDKDEISFISIREPKDGDTGTYDLIVKLKDNRTLVLKCGNQWEADDYLNTLTTRIDPVPIGNPYNYYIVRSIERCNDHIRELESTAKQLINSFKRLKNKEIKGK